MTLMDVKQRILQMKTPLGGAQYYALTIIASDAGQMEWSAISHWVGYTEGSPRRELRAASLVRADYVIESWELLNHPYVVVNNVEDFLVFLLIGGNALIERSLAESKLEDVLKPQEVSPTGFCGFKAVKSIPKETLNRAPTKKLRMRIFKRDDYRCRVCGRRSSDHVDVELHVHHIRQWAKGGLTEEDNLLTLCHTCHAGLDPHEDFALFSLFNSDKSLIDIDRNRNNLIKGIIEYRNAVQSIGTVRKKSS